MLGDGDTDLLGLGDNDTDGDTDGLVKMDTDGLTDGPVDGLPRLLPADLLCLPDTPDKGNVDTNDDGDGLGDCEDFLNIFILGLFVFGVVLILASITSKLEVIFFSVLDIFLNSKASFIPSLIIFALAS